MYKLLVCIFFLLKLLKKEGLKNPYKKLKKATTSSSTMVIFANGPSLMEDIDKLNKVCSDKFPDNCSIFAMNNFACHEAYQIYKPKYYVLSDHVFLKNTPHAERGKKVLNDIAHNTTWPIDLFLPYWAKNSDFYSILKNNKLITIHYFHSTYHIEIGSYRRFIFKNGLGNGEYGSVVLNAEYISMMLDYKNIYLCGVDHTFFNGLYVNEKNQLCMLEEYFYEKKEIILYNHYTDEKNLQPYSVYEYLKSKTSIFYGHEVMEDFANFCNTKIINVTSKSMIDSYERLESHIQSSQVKFTK